MAATLQLAEHNPELAARVRYCRRLLNRRALVAAAASAVPVPGLDWAVDAALLSKLVPEINRQFGLSPEQLDQLPHHKREQAQKAIGAIGSMLVGKFITRDLVLRFAGKVGMRMSAKQAARYVPLAGQLVSALVGYSAIRYLGEEHIRDCIAVVQSAHLALPAPALKAS
ncbi:hypothetical protein ACFPOE_19940 [Caenimonas terrae]|uniref:DUF697 domain-containing protein n=1 Tax=Caenimonas terrae TaxID=696074 RepID=A0ABW0NL14_9BURK